MCIADLTGSISTELGNFHSVELSESVFSSLAIYPWTPSGADGTVSCSIFEIPEEVQTKDRENACVDFLFLFVGSGSNSVDSPETHIFTDDGFDFAVDSGQEILVWQGGGTNQNTFIEANQLSVGTPLVSWANDIYQYVQITSISFDANDSIAVNWTTTGTNSYQLQNGVVLRGFTDDYCTCKPSASIKDFPCETTTSFCVTTQSFIIQLSGSDSGGWEGGANLQNSSLLDATEGSTLKSYSLIAQTPSQDPTSLNSIAGAGQQSAVGSTVELEFNSFGQEMTASFTDMTEPVKLDVCYTESRILGPITTTPPVPYQFDQGSLQVDNLPSMSLDTDNPGNSGIFSGSASDLQNVVFLGWFGGQKFGPPEIKFVTFHQEVNASSFSQLIYNVFVQCTGSHADLPTSGYVSRSYTHFGSHNYHFHLFASDSADDGNLSPSHPSYSNAGYSLAWKINSLWTASAGYYGYPFFGGNYYRNQTFSPYNFGSLGFMDTTHTNINSRGGNNGIHSWPSASYAYKPTNIRSRSADFVHPCPVESDFESEYHGDKIWFISPQTGSRCESHNDPSFRNLSWSPTSSGTGLLEVFSFQTTHSFITWDGAACGIPEKVTDYGAVAEDQCCIQLIMNLKPTESFASPVCQSNFGTRIDLNQDLPFRHADNVIFTLASGAIGNFSSFENGRPGILDIDTQSFAKGKITLCYTASRDNPFCTDTASGIPNASPPFTPDCCPAISGCVDFFFHPGFTAGKNTIHCFPTMSIAGTPNIFTFTETDVSEPTWSLAGGFVQTIDGNGNYTGQDYSAVHGSNEIINQNGTFGIVNAATNSFVTEILMDNPTIFTENFGFFTMSCQVSNGPCTFVDTSLHYVARTRAFAGPDRTRCVNGDAGGPVNAENLITLQATGSGFWSYVTPAAALDPAFSNLIVDSSNPTSPYRIAVCAPVSTIQWTSVSSSTVLLGNEEHGITCTDTDQVNITVKKKRQAVDFLGHLNSSDDASGDIFLSNNLKFTSSFSQSPFITSFRGPLAGGSFVANWPHVMTSQDTLHDMHIFGSGRFNFHINYNHDSNAVIEDNFYILTQTNQSAGPFHIYGASTGENLQNEARLFRFKENVNGLIHGATIANSGSGTQAGLTTQSKFFIPFGPNNPSQTVHTTSRIVFSGSNSASYAAPSTIIRNGIKEALGLEAQFNISTPADFTDKTYYKIALTASYDDCNCEPIGAQGRLFFHLHAKDFRFVTQSTSLIYNHPTSPSTPIATGTFFINEPTLGIDVPVYRDVFMLNFVSESVVVSSTGSSVIYHHKTTLNTCAPFLTSSVGHDHHGQNNQGPGAMTAATNKSSSLTTVSSWNGAAYHRIDEAIETRARAFPIHIDALGVPSNTINSSLYVPLVEYEDSTISTSPSQLVRRASSVESLGPSVRPSMTVDEIKSIFYENGSSGMSNMGFGIRFRWKAREIAIYRRGNTTPLVRGSDIANILITGSFLDTYTSESYIEAPTFLPACRAYSQSVISNPYSGYSASFISGTLVDAAGTPVNRGLESGADGVHVPYFTAGTIADPNSEDMKQVVSQSVIFECTASVHDHTGRLIKEYTAEQPTMFIMTELRG